ncbi:glycosyltransferase family 4 protein [Chloroflexota bacterium]
MEKKLKVLMMGFTGRIGLTYHLARIALGLKQQGLDVVVFTTDKEQVKGLKRELNEKGIKYYEGNFLDKKTKLGVYCRAIREISAIIKDEDIDIVQSHGFLIPVYLASRPPFAGRKVLVVDMVHSFWHRTKSETFLCRVQTILMNLCPDISLPVSEQLRQELIAFGVKPEKLTVVHWGIDLEKFDRDKSSDKYLSKYQASLDKLGEKTVVQSGMLYPLGRKGQEYLLKAVPAILQAFPDTKFLIVGDGPLRGQLEELVRELGIGQSVIFTGEVEGDFIPRILGYADVGVVVSLLETFCIALIELMASGKPVVSTPVGVAPEIVTPENDIGFIVPLRDPDALTQAIIKLLAAPAMAREMGSRGRKLVETSFTMNVMAGNLKRIYESVTNISS